MLLCFFRQWKPGVPQRTRGAVERKAAERPIWLHDTAAKGGLERRDRPKLIMLRGQPQSHEISDAGEVYLRKVTRRAHTRDGKRVTPPRSPRGNPAHVVPAHVVFLWRRQEHASLQGCFVCRKSFQIDVI